jgi:hypothetical protein
VSGILSATAAGDRNMPLPIVVPTSTATALNNPSLLGSFSIKRGQVTLFSDNCFFSGHSGANGNTFRLISDLSPFYTLLYFRGDAMMGRLLIGVSELEKSGFAVGFAEERDADGQIVTGEPGRNSH